MRSWQLALPLRTIPATLEAMDADVLVIGGGAAGLSAALMLVRSWRTVVVVDAGQPRNAPAEAMHGFLSRDGMSPLELLRIGREEVESYGGTIRRGEATTARKLDDRFEVDLADGSTLTARRLVVTTTQAEIRVDLETRVIEAVRSTATTGRHEQVLQRITLPHEDACVAQAAAFLRYVERRTAPEVGIGQAIACQEAAQAILKRIELIAHRPAMRKGPQAA